ncbi:hypothetical protein ACKWTF_009614 [Chironomus riparius]
MNSMPRQLSIICRVAKWKSCLVTEHLVNLNIFALNPKNSSLTSREESQKFFFLTHSIKPTRCVKLDQKAFICFYSSVSIPDGAIEKVSTEAVEVRINRKKCRFLLLWTFIRF